MTQQDYISQNKDRFMDELFTWLRIPSISADKSYKHDMIAAANFVKDKLVNAGADNVSLEKTAGNPIVYGEKIIDSNLPTVLVYGHYDVQPSAPDNLWTSPAFEPEIRNGNIYARGACDDKGQVFMHLAAFETMIKTNTLTCNVKFMIEGEEEVGSTCLYTYIEEKKEQLKADMVLVSDTSMVANDIPSIEVGLRGLSYIEIEVTGPNRDLHSGIYGGGVANPIVILSQLIANLFDENNHITIDGFYDNVMDLSDDERKELNEIPFDLDEYKKDLDISNVLGEKGYTTLERTSIRPCLDINGIWGGYTGEGAKTVLPSKAYAKLSTRLVPNQSSAEITKKLQKHFDKVAPDCVQVIVKPHHGGEPIITPTDFVGYKAAAAAMEQTFGKKPIPARSGGSIPIIAAFERVLGLKTVLMGFGLDSDAIHSPNEHYGVFNFYKGIETIPVFFQKYAEMKK